MPQAAERARGLQQAPARPTHLRRACRTATPPPSGARAPCYLPSLAKRLDRLQEAPRLAELAKALTPWLPRLAPAYCARQAVRGHRLRHGKCVTALAR